MARQRKNTRRRPRIAPASIEQEAELLAQVYGIAVSNGRRCSQTLIDGLSPDYVCASPGDKWDFRGFPLCLFRDALKTFSSSQAIRFIRREDLPSLVRRIQAAEYLGRPDTPYFSLAELAGHAGDFAHFLLRHREYLVRTGLPPRYFEGCHWLYVHLGRLYDTRSTASCYPVDELFPTSEADDLPPYRFIRTPPGLRAIGDYTECEVEHADLLLGMESEDADRIEQDRHRLFEVKHRVVKSLAEVSPRAGDNDVLRRCLDELANKLNADDMGFYLRMDRYYLGRDARPGRETWSRKWSPGGITNLLEALQKLLVGSKPSYESEHSTNS